jgi:hypothetical protein
MISSIHLSNTLLIFLIGVIWVYSGDLLGQSVNSSDTKVNHQIWIDLYPHHYINDKLEYYGDTGYRTIINSKIWSRIYVRPSVRYHVNNWLELHGGLGLFYIFNDFDVNQFEIRPWQGILANARISQRLRIKPYLRLEERISFLTKDWSSSFELRLRFKISGRYDLGHNSSNTFWFIPFYVESFLPIRDEIEEFFQNRGRAGIGAGYNASKIWRFSFLLNWQTSRSGPENELRVSDYVYQLKVRMLWSKK